TEEAAGGQTRLRILSNLADHRLARAAARIPFRLLDTRTLSGAVVARRMVEAWAFAAADPYRAATHNKGVMNGIDAVAIATGQDWRGIEAGAHAYACRGGAYRSLTTWTLEDSPLVGTVEVPMGVSPGGPGAAGHPRGAAPPGAAGGWRAPPTRP